MGHVLAEIELRSSRQPDLASVKVNALADAGALPRPWCWYEVSRENRCKPSRSTRLANIAKVAAAVTLTALACLPARSAGAETGSMPVCADEVLKVGFYADFVPLSHSEDPHAPTNSRAYNTHRGYEADLLTALEALDGAGLSFSRSGIPTLKFEDIWLLAATPQYDLIGGGITIRDARTRDAGGSTVIAFTSGHVGFRQSLLVRSEDATRITTHAGLTQNDRVSVHRGTTGELRLLELTRIIDPRGVLVAGAQVETAMGVVIADGTTSYTISTGPETSPALTGRSLITPPAPLPQVVYHSEETEQLRSLRDREVTAVARGEIGNTDASIKSSGTLVVTALDPEVERGGFALDVKDRALLACLNTHVDRLTDSGRIGYAAWAANPRVFLARAAKLNAERTAARTRTAATRGRAMKFALAGFGRTLAADSVDVIGTRFRRPAGGGTQATLGGQALNLHGGRGWRALGGVALQMAGVLGVDTSSIAGGWRALAKRVNTPWEAREDVAANPWGTPGTGQDGAVEDGRDAPRVAGYDPAVSSHGAWAERHREIRGDSWRDLAGDVFPGREHAGWRQPVNFRRVSAKQVLSQSSFSLPLGQKDATDAGAWTLWGRGNASGFSGKPKADFGMDGDVFSGYLGLDYRPRRNVLLGLAVSHAAGTVDYETRPGEMGRIDTELTSVMPYAHWTVRPGLGVWGLLGAGWGDAELTDPDGEVNTDIHVLMVAGGARQEVAKLYGVDLAVKTDAFLVALESDAKTDLINEAKAEAERVRLMLEGRSEWAISEHARLVPSLELGGRWDAGSAETGVGAELAGGVAYTHTKLGLGVEARGRYLLAHEKDDFEDWGASLMLRIDPAVPEHGLWLTLAPVWGRSTAADASGMWDGERAIRASRGFDLETGRGWGPEQMDVEIGYGLATHEGKGLMTSYGGVSLTQAGTSGYWLGERVVLSEAIALSVETQRRERVDGAAEHGATLRGHVYW